jgi:NAD(P)-dependent dehydrogenase (short-subunit alcohol dehydrogenase family)
MSSVTNVNPQPGTATFPADHRRARLHDHVAFVTSGTRGIGAAICRSFAEQGATVDEVIEAHGRLDILVNNAGMTIDKTVLKMTDEDWYRVIAVKLSGAFFTSQAVLPHVIERGSGRIVNVSSIIGETGNMQANYAASKSGLFGLIARAVHFLVAGKSSHITGQTLRVNGGMGM